MRGGALVRRGTAPPVDTGFREFLPGTVKPVGFYDGGTTPNIGPRYPLTAVNGDVTIGAGVTVERKEIFGKVIFTGAGTLRDCWVHGPVATPPAKQAGPVNRTLDAFSIGVGIVEGNSFNLRGGLIEWCRLDATGYESSYMDGIRGGNYTCRYTAIHRAVDGGGFVQVGNGTLYCCRINANYWT